MTYFSDAECVIPSDGYIYYGIRNVTYDGKECLPWIEAKDIMNDVVKNKDK